MSTLTNNTDLLTQIKTIVDTLPTAPPTVEQATPSISVSSSGLITATSAQTEGYVEGGTTSATHQLTTQASTTITPGTSNKTAVASGIYTTGDIIVAGDSDLVASNIKSGVNIFGVAGAYLPNMKLLATSSQDGGVLQNEFTFTFTGMPMVVVRSNYYQNSYKVSHIAIKLDSGVEYLYGSSSSVSITMQKNKVVLTLKNAGLYYKVDIYGVQ